MKRKWIVLASVALVLGALVTVAVAEHGEKVWEHRTWKHNPLMLGHLDLTEEQQEQLQALREKHEEAMREQRETMAAMREEYRESVNEILTEEQRATLGPNLEIWVHRGPEDILRRGAMWAHRVPGDILSGEYIDIESIKGSIGDIRESLEHWGSMWGIKSEFAKLGLTGEQKELLKELHKEQREEFYKWRRKQRKAMENILTDEQREKLEMLKDEAFYGGKYGAFR